LWWRMHLADDAAAGQALAHLDGLGAGDRLRLD